MSWSYLLCLSYNCFFVERSTAGQLKCSNKTIYDVFSDMYTSYNQTDSMLNIVMKKQ